MHKSLYGLSNPGALWNETITKALIADGFKQSAHGKWLFLKRDMIVFPYIDDCGVCSLNGKLIDEFIERLTSRGFELTKDRDFGSYCLGTFSTI